MPLSYQQCFLVPVRVQGAKPSPTLAEQEPASSKAQRITHQASELHAKHNESAQNARTSGASCVRCCCGALLLEGAGGAQHATTESSLNHILIAFGLRFSHRRVCSELSLDRCPAIIELCSNYHRIAMGV